MKDASMIAPYATWTPDCQGKQDFDGPLLSISTRYYPGPDGGGAVTFDTSTGELRTSPYGSCPSASASIILNIGPRAEHDGGGDYLVWAEEQFEAETEAEVKAAVELWARAQMLTIITRLGGLDKFKQT